MDITLQEKVDQWLALDSNKCTRGEILNLVQTDIVKLRRVMEPRIGFGTAGLRAEMGPGFALMNSVTVTQASQGLAKYVASNVADAKQRGVVIGHDHRHHSKDFAIDIARTFAHEGYKLHFLGEVHTPMVPFAISYLSASCGVMVTASHNPAKDNGYKVYWENACQIIPPHDAGISREIDANLNLWDATLPKYETINLFSEYYEEVIRPLTLNLKTLPKFKIVYTPMHGVGLEYALACFDKLGISSQVTIVPEQAHPDPDFPTVKFPNPEEKGALDLAMKRADEVGARVVFANDPDADRFTCAVREDLSWRQLTGDQIGALFTDFILTNLKSKEKPVAIVNSTVSSRQMQYQAEKFNVKYYETLTGFKWIGNKAIDLEAKGYSVPFAYEEAIGYMVGGHSIKDKDGISALHIFTQLLGSIYEKGSNALKELDRIAQETGYFATHNSYYIVPSPSVTVQVFDNIRTLAQDYIGDMKVTAWRDLKTGYDSNQPDQKALLPISKSSDMLTVELLLAAGERARFTARGSGTEPKLKVYIEASANSEAQAQKAADTVWDTLAVEWFKDI